MFATSIEQNCVHGSDSIENGKIETDFFFGPFEYLS
jgi:nucleoside diphosphate kinase